MARMRNPIGIGLLLILVGCWTGCEMDGSVRPGMNWGQPPQRAVQTNTPATQPAPSSIKPSPTQELAPSPQVAALQQDVQEYVNRFPDNEVARKISPAEAQQAPQPIRIADAPTTRPAATEVQASATPAPAPAPAAQPQPAAAPTVSKPAPQPEVIRVASPNTSQQEPLLTPTAPSPAAAAPAPSPETAVNDAHVARANAPLAPREIVRAKPGPAPKIEAIEIAPVPEASKAEQQPAKVETNRAVTSEAAPQVSDVTERISKLEKALAERPADLDSLFKLRMLYLAEGMDDKAASPVAGVAPEVGEMYKNMVSSLIAVRDAARDPLSRTPQAMEQMQKLGATLRNMAPVVIDRALLVSRVNSFGDYTEVTPAEFPVGQPNRTILYVEVSNFRSEKQEDGLFHTMLSMHAEIYDENGKSIWKQAHDKIPDVCRRLRNDFFLACEVDLPETLSPGKYTVKVTVEDKLSATADQAQASLSLVVPKQPVAATGK